MRRFILIGPMGHGKSTLCQALNDLELRYKKTQAVEVFRSTIDTPGEYLEIRRLNPALMIAAVEAEIIVLVQSCGDERSLFPPGFSDMFGGKPVWGAVSKTDLARDEASITRAEALLKRAGASALFRVSCRDPDSVRTLRESLVGEIHTNLPTI